MAANELFRTTSEETKMRTKLAVLGLAAAATLSVLSFSTGAFAAACTTGTAATYIALGATGCTVGDETFNNLNWPTVGSLTPAMVTVTPVGAGTSNPGLMFSSPGFTNLGLDVPLNPNFTVTAPSAEIIDAGLTLACNGTCTGLFDDIEQIGTPAVEPFLEAGTNPGQSLSVAETFAGVTGFTIQEDIDLTHGNQNLFSLTKTFSETVPAVPEPASLALLASGLFGLGWLGRRRRQRG